MNWKQTAIIFFLFALILKVGSIHVTYENYLLVGSDGPYYPLQIRALLEGRGLAFADMPLLFWLEALVAKSLQWLGVSASTSILWAAQSVPALLSSLAAIPLALLANCFHRQQKWIVLFAIAFGLFNFSSLQSFPGSLLHKNEVAIPLVFSFLFFAIRFIQNGKKQSAIGAGMVLILCALTHFGSFAFLLLISGLYGIIAFAENFRISLKRLGFVSSSLCGAPVAVKSL